VYAKRRRWQKKIPTMNSAKLFFLVTLALCRSGLAQLRWENRELEFHPAPSESEVVANYRFTNTGKRTVTIREVKTSCGCTTATLEKRTYAPGEKGKITATFEIATRSGLQEKSIYVATDDPHEPELVLTLKATIPKVLDLSGIFLNWKQGEELKAKTVDVRVTDNFPVKNISVTSSNPDIGTEVKHTAGSKDFQIIVTPKKAGAAISAGLEVIPDFPNDNPKVFHVYVRVDH
jgi:Protein of unknown function (DUF1573)